MPNYELKIDLNALNHLGLNLYSNVSKSIYVYRNIIYKYKKWIYE